jgi:cobalt-zinc-cadmium efflux system outer membrane protein
LLTQVRTNYFAVLVALETVKITRALTRFTDEVYSVQTDQVRGSVAAAYEPLQLRVLAFQSRGALVQARNRYTSAWKQLAATMGLPAMPPTELAGRVDMPIPRFRYDALLARVLATHSYVVTSQNTLQKARYNLRLAQMTPVPDVTVHLAIQKDFTTPPFQVAENVQMGVPLPVWDQNKGNIIQAQGALLRGVEEAHRVRDDLTNHLATAFEQYENNRVLLEYFLNHMLPDQVQAYRGVYARHQWQPDQVSFGDIVQAQQTLVTTVTTYLTTLGSVWTAVVNVADLLETTDFSPMGLESQASQCVPEIPTLDQLPALPCCHPNSPLPGPELKTGDGSWPPAIREGETSRDEGKLEMAPAPAHLPPTPASPPRTVAPSAAPTIPPAPPLPRDSR